MTFIIDWVGVYSIVYITLTVVLYIVYDGKARTGVYRWYDGFIAILLYLPFMGKVFGWW